MITKKMVQVSLIFPILFSLSACVSQGSVSKKISNPHQMVEVKEKLYRSTLNYNQLIELYRKTLSDPAFKQPKMQNLYLYKLSETYFVKGDYTSALLYMQKLVNVHEYKERVTLLELKTLVEMGEYDKALKVAKNYHTIFPASANVYNSQGIAYAGLGKYELAKESFNQARSLFLNDVVSLNNLAMLALLKGEYKNAVRLLLPQYLNGEKDKRLLSNLVLALVKVGDVTYARQIIEKENLSSHPTDLIKGLKRTTHLSRVVVVSDPSLSTATGVTPTNKGKTKAETAPKEAKAMEMGKSSLPADKNTKTLVMRDGVSLMQLFREHHLELRDILAISQAPNGELEISRLRSGQQVQIYLTPKGNVSKMVLPNGSSFTRKGNNTYRYQR